MNHADALTITYLAMALLSLERAAEQPADLDISEEAIETATRQLRDALTTTDPARRMPAVAELMPRIRLAGRVFAELEKRALLASIATDSRPRADC
jgi:hypothetical protein